MSLKCTVIATYPIHTDAEAAIKQLQLAGFDMTKLSIVGKDYHTEENVIGYYNAGDRMKAWGKRGAFWGGIWSLLLGSAFFMIPGIGPLVVAGPLVQLIVSVLEGAIVLGSLSALGGALYSMGIPEDSIVQYEMALRADAFLVIAHGSEKDVRHAKEILEKTTCTHVRQFADGEKEQESLAEVL